MMLTALSGFASSYRMVNSLTHRSWRPIGRHGRADDRARLQPLLPLELCSVGCPSSVELGARESSVLLAGRGRPPQAAARRAGLEVVEKLLTSIEVRLCGARK